MKQILIVSKTPAYAYNISDANDLSALGAGSIAFFNLSDNSKITANPTEDFGIALGRPNNSAAFVIPEVDVKTLSIVKADYNAGTAFTATLTVPTVAAGNTYTTILIKTGVMHGERSNFTATVTVPFGDTSTNASAVATKIRAYYQSLADAGTLNITVSGSGANVIITGKTKGEGFVFKAADDMSSVSATSVTVATPPIGDVAYIKDLASQCAAGKGFDYVEGDGKEIYPGYPEALDGTTYNIYTLRFQVGRKSAKTRDEKVWQLVHIAVPTDATCKSSLEDILEAPDTSSSTASTASTSGSGGGDA